jgi:hypothetical protein
MATGELLQKMNTCSKRPFQFIIICSLILVFAYSSYAQDDIIRNGLYLGFSLGYGNTGYKYQDINTSDDTLAMGLQAGYAIIPDIILGLETNGWTIRAYNDSSYYYYYYYYYEEPTEGESISNVSLFLNVFPFHNRSFYITGGIGKAYYENYSRYEHYKDDGGEWFLGCGYEFPITKRLMYAPQFRYSRGNFSNGEYNVKEISIALHWYPKW